MHGLDYSPTEFEQLVGKRLGTKVSSVACLGGGRNSRVYRFASEGMDQYAVKIYFARGREGKSGLDREFAATRFLWQNGIQSIARPIEADPERGYAVFDYIEGCQIAPEEVTAGDIDRAVDFLVGLRRLTDAEDCRSLPDAAEACFSYRAILRNIEQRLTRLEPAAGPGTQSPGLRPFLEDEFKPALREVTQWCNLRRDETRIFSDAELEARKRTLSPSDFGFHNALKTRDGRIVFLDFEHFGWDDPAKMIADFLLHPAMLLSQDLRQRFFSRILAGFAEDEELFERIRTVYPLFGLKWCTILLNEFIPEHLSRREFASQTAIDREELKAGQLTKARMMLDRVKSEYADFPYSTN